MFVFGEPTDVAEMLLIEVAGLSGPGLPDKSKEWGYEEWRQQLIYTSAALRRAASKGMETGILEALCEHYEEALVGFCRHDDVVMRAMDNGMHVFPWNDSDAKQRQKMLVEAVWELGSEN